MSKKILVTAGPTIEPLDPIRYLSNHSTGTMGYEIAKECVKRGHEVCLISGPVQLSLPAGVDIIDVETAREMKVRVMEQLDGADCLIMASAVCDYRPDREEAQKIKKGGSLNLKLVRNPDILSEASGKEGLIKVGFALETENPVQNAMDKLKAKDLDMIIVNTKSGVEDPFGQGKKRFVLINAAGAVKEFADIDKGRMASHIIDEVENLLK